MKKRLVLALVVVVFVFVTFSSVYAEDVTIQFYYGPLELIDDTEVVFYIGNIEYKTNIGIYRSVIPNGTTININWNDIVYSVDILTPAFHSGHMTVINLYKNRSEPEIVYTYRDLPGVLKKITPETSVFVLKVLTGINN